MPVTRLASFRSTIHAVVRQQDDGIDLVVLPQAVDQLLQFRLANAEGPVGREALGMRDRHVGQRLADDADAEAADLLDRRRLEYAAAGASKAGLSSKAASSVRNTFCARNSPLKRLMLARSLLFAVGEFPVRRSSPRCRAGWRHRPCPRPA